MKRWKSIVLFCVAMAAVIATVLVAAVGVNKNRAGSARNIILGLDLRGGVSITYQVKDEEFTRIEMDDTVYKLQRRVAEYSADAIVYQEGADRITVEIPGVYDTEKVIAELGQPGSLQFITYDHKDEAGNIDYSTYTIWVTGDQISGAQAGSRTDPVEYFVQLAMNEEGAAKFADATSTHIGEIIYIIYDNEVVSNPVVKSAITNGECVIEGMSSYEEASTLASTIRIGSLKLELEEISSKVVSAKLGSNAVKTSLLAGLVGLLVIIIFMISTYRMSGVAASIAMIFYSGAMLVLLNAFNLTLTVSGIAGIILSIGMAVDGNVIINVRIKEELAVGASLEQAIKSGFKRSTPAILDGNITTLIVAIVLLIFGSGSISGFGMTLAIGIVLSVFTSLVVSRVIMVAFYGIGITSSKAYAVVKKTSEKTFDFIGKKIIWFAIAIVCIVAGAAAMIVNASAGRGIMNFSIEFVGGVSTTVDFQTDYSIDSFNNTIKKDVQDVIGSTDIEGQKVSGTTQYVIKTPELSQENITELKAMLVDKYGADSESFEITRITPIISKELQRDALISLAISAALMLIYIWIRFRKFKVAVSAVIALLHDVIIVIAFFAIFRVSAGNSFIACILTIVGYSINATIVIFDRIREVLSNPMLNYDLKKVINTSIRQSLTRCVFTSATTFVTVLFLYIFGIEAMKAFALPLGVGIVAGAFSSIFISGNLVYLFTKKSERYDEKGANIAARYAASQGVTLQDAVDIAESAGAESVQDLHVKIKANPNRKKKKRRKQ